MKLFNKATVLIFSTLFSTFLGALIFSDNLKTLNKGKFIIPTILFSIVWTVITNKILSSFNVPYVPFLIANFFGGLILIGPIWNHHIEKELEYETKPIWMLLLSLAILFGAIFGILYYSHFRQL